MARQWRYLEQGFQNFILKKLEWIKWYGLHRNKNVGKQIISKWGCTDRIIMLKLKLNQDKQCYAHIFIFRQRYGRNYEQLEKISLKMNYKNYLVIIGDIITVIGESKKGYTAKNYGLGSRNGKEQTY